MMMKECYQTWAQLEREAGTQLHRWAREEDQEHRGPIPPGALNV